MDWSLAKHEVPPRHEPAAPTPLTMCWRVHTPSGNTLTCTIVRDAAPGVDVRVEYSASDLLRSERRRDVETAQQLADAWKSAALRIGCTEAA